MASSFPSSLTALTHLPRIWRFKESSLNNGITSPIRSKPGGVFCCCKNTDFESCYGASGGAKRREVMVGLVLTTFSYQALVSSTPALADPVDVAEEYRSYTDEVNKFKMVIPQDWEVGSGEPNGFKSVTAFYPSAPEASSSVSVVITGVGPDFTRLESFGKVEAFADTLVSGLDRSWQRPPGVAAKLIDCRSANGLYYIEYTLQNPGERRKHLYSAIGMASNGWYNRLYTITGQYADEEAESYSSKIEKAVNSFKFI